MNDLLFPLSDTFFSCRQSNGGALVVWKVKSFSTLKEKSIKSPKFSFEKIEWYLYLNPDGNINNHYMGYVGLFLTPCLPFASKLRYRLFLKDECGSDVHIESVLEWDFPKSIGYGFGKFLLKQDLLDGKLGNLLPGDTLTVCCAMKTAETTEGITEPIPENIVLSFGADSFVENFREMFDSGRFSDVFLRVGKETIPAHKVILSGHSSVFKAMFESDMKESQENTVDLIDMDVTVAKAMLLYMYTREVEGLSAEQILQLYVVADRYMLTELKDKCRDFLSNHLSPKNVGEVYEIASLHSDDLFMDSVMKFFADNMKNIIKTTEWEKFSKEKANFSVELFTYAVLRNDFI